MLCFKEAFYIAPEDFLAMLAVKKFFCIWYTMLEKGEKRMSQLPPPALTKFRRTFGQVQSWGKAIKAGSINATWLLYFILARGFTGEKGRHVALQNSFSGVLYFNPYYSQIFPKDSYGFAGLCLTLIMVQKKKKQSYKDSTYQITRIIEWIRCWSRSRKTRFSSSDQVRPMAVLNLSHRVAVMRGNWERKSKRKEVDDWMNE